ncbi:hypothetical protein J3E68DRAFT_396219 [Trichoderma sp. SZMC 28012]
MRACLTRYCTPSFSRRVTLPVFPVWYLAALCLLLGELRGMEMRGDCCVVRMACTSNRLVWSSPSVLLARAWLAPIRRPCCPGQVDSHT